MKRHLILLLLVDSPLHAEPRQFLAFGGGASCATWLNNAEKAGNLWVWGYWSGRNVEGVRTTGSTTDQNGVIGEVKLVCQAEPSLSMLQATNKVYERFQREGR